MNVLSSKKANGKLSFCFEEDLIGRSFGHYLFKKVVYKRVGKTAEKVF